MKDIIDSGTAFIHKTRRERKRNESHRPMQGVRDLYKRYHTNYCEVVGVIDPFESQNHSVRLGVNKI